MGPQRAFLRLCSHSLFFFFLFFPLTDNSHALLALWFPPLQVLGDNCIATAQLDLYQWMQLLYKRAKRSEDLLAEVSPLLELKRMAELEEQHRHREEYGHSGGSSDSSDSSLDSEGERATDASDGSDGEEEGSRLLKRVKVRHCCALQSLCERPPCLRALTRKLCLNLNPWRRSCPRALMESVSCAPSAKHARGRVRRRSPH